MDLRDAAAHWDAHGFAVLPAFFDEEELAAGRAELGALFPSAEEFHGAAEQASLDRYRDDEYGGLVTFPFASVALSLLAVHPRLVELARALLGCEDIRIYSAEAWAKFSGAVDYAQDHHRDYLNHTLVVPSDDPAYRNVEMFLFLFEVTEDLGPTHVVSTALTGDYPLLPHSYDRAGHPGLYEAEVSGAGPAGTVLAYRGETLHRATNLTAPAGARYTLHCSFRPASNEWVGRQGWGDRSFDPAWEPFVSQASVAQLALFGFPPPGHPYWTAQTLDGVAVRYPGLDLTPWRGVP
jgi:Phytanoyl-CoA dioxygenase (PhyH)